MSLDEARRRSRWIMRAMEWDDPKARYPNVWHEGMPRQILAFDTVATRVRLGDLIAVFSPPSAKHPERSERFVGIARVVAVRRAHDPSLGWIELETAHRFEPPLDLGEGPRRVFLCCDPGWPPREVAFFRRVFDAAVAAGWKPTEEEGEEGASRPAAPPRRERDDTEEATPREARPPAPRPPPTGRLFAGVDYSGDMRDPKDKTWLAVVERTDADRLRLVRLEATGRTGLERHLRDADAELQRVEAFGLDFPFALPIPFAESLLGGPFPEEGWWALAKRLERMTRPEYLIALQEFRDAHGELKRLTDERAQAFSPLHRVNPDLGPMTYHGIRMIAEDRSRFAVRPFESAKGRLLLEVYPGGSLRRLGVRAREDGEEGRSRAILQALSEAASHPVDVGEPFRRNCLDHRDALDAVLAARCAAVAVLGGEVDRPLEELAPGESDRLRKEGWIYGLGEESHPGA